MLALKNHYELDQAMPDAAMVDERARLAGPDRDAMRSVVAALCELVRVKERLDLFVRSGRLHVSGAEQPGGAAAWCRHPGRAGVRATA